MKRKYWVCLALLALIAGLLASCAPATPALLTQDPAAIASAAVETYQSGLTATAAANPTATIAPSATPEPAAGISATLGEPAPTLAPPPVEDKATFIRQNPPDGSEVGLGDKFDVLWVVRNDGPTTWTPRYSIRYFSGAMLGERPLYYFPRDVPPGDEVRLVVDLVAPNYTGQFNTNWVLTNADGVNFYPVNLQIKVVAGPTRTLTPTSTSTPTPGPSPTKVEG